MTGAMLRSPGIRDRIVELRRVRAGDLVPDPRNWRRHPKAQRDALQGVLAEIGYADALLARETPDGLVLIDGHLRAGLDPNQTVPVLVVDLDEAEAGKLLATLDPLAAMAQPDQDALLALLRDVSFEDEAVNDMLEALANRETQPGLTDPDDVPEPQEESYVKRGDIWQLGQHRLICGEAPQDMALLGDVSGSLVLTDPPYGINIVKGLSPADSSGAKPFGRVRQPGGRAVGVLGGDQNRRLERLSGKVGKPGVVKPRLYHPVTGDDVRFDPTFLLGLGNHQIIFGGTYFATKLRDGTAWIGWDKGIGDDATFSGFESAWTSFEGRFRLYRHRWSGMIRAGNRKEELQDRVHPTQKPVGLFADILCDFPDFALVCDPFLGSGTTLIACEKLGRVCYGMEIEPRYCGVAIERWQNYTGRKAVKL
mgnify:CR=1 FL=1